MQFNLSEFVRIFSGSYVLVNKTAKMEPRFITKNHDVQHLIVIGVVELVTIIYTLFIINW